MTLQAKFATLVCIATLTVSLPYAQSLRGKIIYVSPTQEVNLKFRSVVENYSFVNKVESGRFKIKVSNNRNLRINSLVSAFRPANIVITEGENTHLFILAYKDKLAESEIVYDFSSKEKLQDETYRLTKGSSPPAKQPAQPNNMVVTQAINKVEAQPAQKELDTKYADLVALADKAYNDNKLDEANGLYTAALVLKPNDSWCNARLNVIRDIKDSEKPQEVKTVAIETKSKNPAKTNDNAAPKSSPVVTQKNEPKAVPPVEQPKVSITKQQPLEQPKTAVNNQPANQQVTSQPAVDVINQQEYDDIRLAQMRDSIRYDEFIHLADSAAWIAKDYKSSLKWYDSAQKLKPQASYPWKQKRVVKQLYEEKEFNEARERRTTAVNRAMESYKRADRLRVERNFPEAYKGFAEFLKLMEAPDIKQPYLSSESYHINQAKDYLLRLEPYIPKNNPAVQPAPVVEDQKKKKKKKRG
jgi:hypothetical protein